MRPTQAGSFLVALLASAALAIPVAEATPKVPLHLTSGNFGDLLLYNSQSGFAFNVDYNPAASTRFDYLRSAWLPGWELTPARLNNDNLVDVFLYNPTTGAWAWEINTGSGYTEARSGTWSPGWTVFATDFNGDQFDDLFIYNRSTGAWFECLNSGGTGFSYYTGPDWLLGLDIVVGDFNGDLRKDLFTYDPLTGAWTEYFANTSTGIGFTTRGGTWSPGWKIWPVTLNSDALTDLFLYHSDTGVAYQAVSTNTTEAFRYRQESWSPGWEVHPADFNGDGLSDLFLYSAETGVWFECLTVPGGTGFSAYLRGQWSPGWQIHVTDFDGDTRSDLFLYSPALGVYFQGLTTGNGQFTYRSGAWDPDWRIASEIDRPVPLPPPPPPPLPPPPTRPFLTTASILAFGDSITTGVTSVLTSLGTSSLVASRVTTGYPERLRAELQGHYPSQTIAVENKGVPGEPAEYGKNRLSTVLTDSQDLVIILEGVNDTNAGLSASRIAGSLGVMVDTALARNKKVILSTLTPVLPGPTGLYRAGTPEQIRAVNAAIADIAASRNIVLVDMFAAFGADAALLSPDGLHPTDAGYQKMADTFANAIVRHFEVLR